VLHRLLLLLLLLLQQQQLLTHLLHILKLHRLADLVMGSLIKNAGGTLAPGGGYVAGRADLVSAVGARLAAPGIGTDAGGVPGTTLRLLFQGTHERAPALGQGSGRSCAAHKPYREEILLHVDTFAHNQGCIAHQDLNRWPETVVNPKRELYRQPRLPPNQVHIHKPQWVVA
jgi:hypothetical protein